VLTVALLSLGNCATTGSGVLEPVEDSNIRPLEPTVSERLTRLLEVLKQAQYEGIGLEFESDGTLELLNHVFSDPRALNRKLKLIYTGLHLAYDGAYESFTVGGSSDPQAILTYIQKNIPCRNGSSRLALCPSEMP
ncbi:MAG: hypothetical protein HY537_06145, partial [Deltaproteobacteria bacterium]|nr:hypothetical protein [Deltaproteobacteria bacterium]